VIVAEDDTEMRSLLATTLRGDGYEVIEVASGSELLAAIGDCPGGVYDYDSVDLVISDIRMPGQSGLDVLCRLAWKQHEVPVILITAFGEEWVHELAERLGAVAVLDKPLDLDDLRRAVLQVLVERGRARGPADGWHDWR
jgi:CheY-like chemotaxis protein